MLVEGKWGFLSVRSYTSIALPRFQACPKTIKEWGESNQNKNPKQKKKCKCDSLTKFFPFRGVINSQTLYLDPEFFGGLFGTL